jgi:hypothetical protein
MRAMEGRYESLAVEADTGTRTSDHLASSSKKQSFNVVPEDTGPHRISEYRSKRSSMFAVHT